MMTWQKKWVVCTKKRARRPSARLKERVTVLGYGLQTRLNASAMERAMECVKVLDAYFSIAIAFTAENYIF
jgi:hypothetical protein